MNSSTIINFSGRRRSSSIELSKATSWLEYLQLNMETVFNGSVAHYEVQATYTPPYCEGAEIAWSVSRSFDAYRQFRKQLLRRLKPGHACSAECKWLRSVVKNHFPRPRLFAVNSLRTTEARQRSLIRIFRTLQASLVNRGNQGCKVLVRSVCNDFTSFILGDNPNLPDVLTMKTATSHCSSDQSTRNSSASLSSGYESYHEGMEAFGRRCSRGYCRSESGQYM